MSAGHGGQVLLSETTRELLDDDIRPMRPRRAPPQGHGLLGSGSISSATTTFPPLKTLHQTNLPIQPSPLVGRERELAEAGRLLGSHRLLTLTGPGGSGKTRLALQLAADAAEQFPDGVFWVPLQALRDPALVERAIGGAVGAEGDLIAHVGEQAAARCSSTTSSRSWRPRRSSRRCWPARPNAKVLITSREPLHLDVRAAVSGRAIARARCGDPLHRARERHCPGVPPDGGGGRDLPTARRPTARDRARRGPGRPPRAGGSAGAARPAAAAAHVRAPATRRRGNERCTPRSNGATSSSTGTNSSSSEGSRCSAAASRSRRPRPFATPISTRSSRLSTRASFAAGQRPARPARHDPRVCARATRRVAGR